VVIGRTTFTFGYDSATGMLKIQIPIKINRVPFWVLTSELWEVKVLHGGRLLEEINAFVGLHRIDELDFNPEDAF
jgi:hypothetical protein